MSQINATIESNLKLPIVTALPVSGVAGTQFVFENNVYLFNASGAPVRVGLDFAQATFVPTFANDVATITTTQSYTVTKVGNLVTISGSVLLTVTETLLDGLVITGIPEGFRPAGTAGGVVANHESGFAALISYTCSIQANQISISADTSGILNSTQLTIIGSWTV